MCWTPRRVNEAVAGTVHEARQLGSRFGGDQVQSLLKGRLDFPCGG